MLVNEILSELIFKTRKETGKTQDQIAELLGISNKQYRNIENGYSLPMFDTLLRLRIILKIDINQICDDIVKEGYSIEDRV